MGLRCDGNIAKKKRLRKKIPKPRKYKQLTNKAFKSYHLYPQLLH